MKKIKRQEIPIVTQQILKKQGHRCALCDGSLRPGAKKQPVLDHCHTKGNVRDVLCRNCNGIEGKIFNLVRRARNGLSYTEYLERLEAYWERHESSTHGLIHPTFKTDAEKRLAANKKRQALKKGD